MATRRIVAVAYSGGRDSTALLHATCAAASTCGLDVVALHVHHGLQPAADAWARQTRDTCRRWRRRGAPLSYRCVRLEGLPGPGESLEAWARAGRYRALATMAQEAGAGLVLLAHHRRDQAETWWLQVLRGAGVAGQAAMPRSVERDGLTWARPWLDMPSEAVAAYVRRHRLSHVHDASNDDTRLARNRLRHEVWPALIAAFPEAEASMARAAAWAQQAQSILAEVAGELAAQVCATGSLALAPWGALDAARRSLVLRHWLQRCDGRPAPATLVDRLLHEAEGRGAAQWPLHDSVIVRHRGALHWRAGSSRTACGVRDVTDIAVTGPGRHPLPAWGGTLVAEPVAAGGLAVPVRLSARARGGGERFQAGPSRPARDLKRQFQAVGIGGHARDVPLFFRGDALAYVPGLGLDARAVAPAGVCQVALRWLPDEASAA